jgi:uracil-DNA glycosylase
MTQALEHLLTEIRGCRRCVEQPDGLPLPHEPRPVLRASASARIAICSQAPGTRVHASGVPFTDPSGDRLRQWLGVSAEEFYDASRVAIVPMGFCFPGQNAKGADLPPRKECAGLWRRPLFAELEALELVLLVGQYAQRWHLGEAYGRGLDETMRSWRTILRESRRPRYLPLPHPSWRNNAWLKANPWFEAEVLPCLRRRVRAILGRARPAAGPVKNGSQKVA